MIPASVLGILACPACDSRPNLVLEESTSELVCPVCKHKYPIRHGIPILLTSASGPTSN
jgi:uncharacterized protein YbaR (Trm112 family)